MHFLDYGFLSLLFVVLPIYSALSFRRFLRLLESGQASLSEMFRDTMWLHIGGLFVFILLWRFLERPASDLGLVLPDAQGALIGVAVILLVSGFFCYTWWRVTQLSAEARSETLESMGYLKHMLPSTDPELRMSLGASLTAGVVEEILYRGYVLWCLSLYMPIWIAAGLSSVAFGVAHAYQGLSGVIKTGVVGFVFAAVYLVTGSLIIVMILHFLVDALQMAAVRSLHRPAPVQQTT